MVKKPAPKKQPKPQPKPRPPQPQQQQATSPASHIAQHEQQKLLSIFSTAFSSVLSSDTFPQLLQGIKTALFNRDFAQAFGREDYLEAYAARWSPTRALCYASVLEGLLEEITGLGDRSEGGAHAGQESPTTDEQAKPIEMVALGGCAAEHVAFSSFLARHSLSGTLTLLDSAPWTHVTQLVQNTITTPPPISQYASEVKKTANKPLLPSSQLRVDFAQKDVLELSKEQLGETIPSGKCLVTIMFTLNELYTNGGIGKTTRLLKTLGEVLVVGSILLVLDSPGSYSEAALGKEKKRYPMQWLLNHTLLETRSEGDEYAWNRLGGDDSVWFRLPENLDYPMQLENMRYQMHLYRLVCAEKQ